MDGVLQGVRLGVEEKGVEVGQKGLVEHELAGIIDAEVRVIGTDADDECVNWQLFLLLL